MENNLEKNLNDIQEVLRELNYRAYSINSTYEKAYAMCVFDSQLLLKAKELGFSEMRISSNGFLELKKDNLEIVFTTK